MLLANRLISPTQGKAVPTKYDSRQLALFPPRPALPSRPFSLDPSPAEIRLCRQCGRQIITQAHTADGQVVSEFVSAAGECFSCKYPEG
jgi:hypothetical protein